MNTIVLADKLRTDIHHIAAAVDSLRGNPQDTTIKAIYLHARSFIAIDALREFRRDAIEMLTETIAEFKLTA
ncbi:hypothetical protein ABW17_12080 [Mycobacterium nebraskense]|uniref:hypothetical protein n=1 Tax=Mycobacterium nebraskense TaxID=244292 RepID=UPI000641C847|nr:hypothetical protein [Mycobacterium nebraskense]KLO42376.1 hypothetical protein ABW17_12080 [Mycobacterium nebraskense]